MEQLPQRESVPQIGVFHTPRLCNTITVLPAIYGYARATVFQRWNRTSPHGRARPDSGKPR